MTTRIGLIKFLELAEKKDFEGILNAEQVARIIEESNWIDNINYDNHQIYGLNTLTGHRDNSKIGLVDQRLLITSHLIPGNTSYFSKFETDCIGLAKVFAVLRGGTGIRLKLLQHIINSIKSDNFKPNIPSDLSYSSGDVIPAAHWAHQLLQYDNYESRTPLQPGEGLGLINGSFVHLGFSASITRNLYQSINKYSLASGCLAALSGSNPSNFKKIVYAEHARYYNTIDQIQQIANNFHNNSTNYISTSPQASVSLRALPDCVDTLLRNYENYTTEINYSLNSRSANPLFDYKENNIMSQSSFMLPNLAIYTSAIIEAILFSAGALNGGFQFILSGRIPNIPIDGNSTTDPFGMIQVPKSLQAIIERMRLLHGRRLYASSGCTSYGIEDSWTLGIEATSALKDCIQFLDKVSLRIITACEFLAFKFFAKNIIFHIKPKTNNMFVPQINDLESLINEKLNSFTLNNSIIV